MTTINKDLIPALNDSLEITLPDNIPLEELQQKLALHINHLINHDFEKLVSLLYRIDVNENKLRGILDNKKGENAPLLIAGLIIDRQLQKLKTRKESKSNNEIPGDEKW